MASMQTVRPVLRHVSARSAVFMAAHPHSAASTSQALQRVARRHASKGTFGWIRDTFGMAVREKNTEEELAAVRKMQAEKGESSVFESIPEEAAVQKDTKKKYTEHQSSTSNFKISHRKLNMLGRQISGKPIDMAILQMQFSEKRASTRIKGMLVVAKNHATGLKGLNPKRLIVSQAWVTKGPKQLKRVEPKGRARTGIRIHPDSKLTVVLQEGKTKVELLEEERRRKLKRIVSAGLKREDVPIRNPGPGWAW
ncbi:mitochondrial 50S ribosomal protein L22 [Daedalea quercina L-15889]|uniref:Mitochondrial 50S ribosomal protein L22 n=1 Tax=Daedalea quercina L-15889 TaxID=1314783 RepID=A0A165U1S8_9APHY|nr:mitochondrial 50S ribosomal protein L22 [Daedalea quercina L-15889]